MFKPKEDRLNYGQLLLPPTGYTLVRAVGTTYSLDLETLMSVCIALGIEESTDSLLTHNPFAILKSLQSLSDKLLLFCDAGQIKAMRPEKSPLMLLLDKIIVPVKMKELKGMEFPSFHPKTWTLQFEDADGNQMFRFIVLSRNLTFDRSWDVAACLDGKHTGRLHRASYPIRDFLIFLKDYALTGVSYKNEKRRIINTLIQELPYVEFRTDDKRFNDFEIIPLGINSVNIDDDPLLKNTFHELLIISPFLSSEVICGFDKRKLLNNSKRHLITRTTELPKIKGKLDNFVVYTMKDSVVEGEELVSDEEITNIQQQDIHAKVYLITKYSDSSLYLGSMNASKFGLHRNVEMMIKLTARRHYLNIEDVEKELFGDNEKNNPFEKANWDVVEDREPEAVEKDALERTLKSICRLKAEAEAELIGEKYNLKIRFSNLRDAIDDVEIAPARTVRTQPLAREVLFQDLGLLELTELYRITIKGRNESISRMIIIPTKIPSERDNKVIKSILKDRRAFIDYLAFILGDDYVMSVLEQETAAKGSDCNHYEDCENLPAIYEKMLRTAYVEPERIKEIRNVMDRVADSDIIPEEFVKMYETFVKTLKLK